jgi:hypothetical protein
VGTSICHGTSTLGRITGRTLSRCLFSALNTGVGSFRIPAHFPTYRTAPAFHRRQDSITPISGTRARKTYLAESPESRKDNALSPLYELQTPWVLFSPRRVMSVLPFRHPHDHKQSSLGSFPDSRCTALYCARTVRRPARK